MIYRVAWVVLIKSIFFVEIAFIKNTHIHQNNDKNCQKVKDADDINIRAVVAFREIGKGLEGVQNVTCCLNMFSIGDPSYHAINEEFLRASEYVVNKSTAKAAIEVSAKAHNLSLILTDATFANRKEVTFAIQKIIHLTRIHFHESASSKYFAGITFRE